MPAEYSENGSRGKNIGHGYSYVGGGVVQMIDAAALEIYLYYRHSTAEMTLLPNAQVGYANAIALDLEDLGVRNGWRTHPLLTWIFVP